MLKAIRTTLALLIGWPIALGLAIAMMIQFKVANCNKEQ